MTFSTLNITDPGYPPLLKQIADPPRQLYLWGEPALLRLPQLAIVGSRNPTATGRELAFEFARTLSQAGLTITSGLATGIDGASHEGALAANGFTVAVLGTGLDTIYPARHQALAEKIAKNGLLVSEYPPGTPPRKAHFPQRNRLISGLSYGVLVVEAALRSGSLITARTATEQGREVFALPGSIHNPLAKGCHHLIQQGAKLVETAQDVLEELNHLHQGAYYIDNGLRDTARAAGQQQDREHQVLLDAIGYEATSVDAIIARTGLTADKISSMLLRLELDGNIMLTKTGYVRVVSCQEV